MSSRLVTLLTPAAFGIAVLVGCSGATPKAAPTQIDLSDYAITVPASIPASMASFTVMNKSGQAHHAALARLDSGKTYADFVAAMKDTTMKGPPPAWIVWLGGAQAFPGAASNVTIPLEAGNYVWYCVIPGADGIAHVMKGMSAPMTVTAGATTLAAAPIADVDVTMSDYTWTMSTPVTAGKHTLKYSGAAGSQPHEAVLVRLQPGKTAKDFLDWAMKMSGPPPIESLGGIPALQPGTANYQEVEFTAGNYALVCFVPDAKDGQPHALHGMVKEFAVQ